MSKACRIITLVGMDRVELRELDCFVAVAEELHFARAAERLNMAPPHVSRTIARLERRVGVQLFDRTSRRVGLTAAGEVFLTDTKAVLASVDAALHRVRRSLRPPRLVIAIRPGTAVDVLAEIIEIYSAPVEYLFALDPAAAIFDKTADVAIMCTTGDLTGLAVIDIDAEEPVALLPASDRAPLRAVMSLNDLRMDERFTPDCPAVSLDELITRVSLGVLVVIVGKSAANRCGPAVRVVPVTGLPSTPIAVTYSQSNRSEPVRAFSRAAKHVAIRHRLKSQPLGSAG